MSEKRIINTPSLFKVDETFDDPRFMKVRINAMTTGVNRNGTSFSLDVVKEAAETFKNIPVLANVIETEDEEGNVVLDYGGHDMHLEEDAFDEDKVRMIYDERVVGLVPETNNFEIIKNDETGEYNVFVDALLLRDYGNYVCDILESRDGKTDVSMEIICNDLSYSNEDDAISVGKMVACAVTLLGADLTPAMPGAHAEVFSMSENDRTSQLAEIMQELKESLDNYMAVIANNNQRKEEDTVNDENLMNESQEEVTTEDFTESTPSEDCATFSITVGTETKTYTSKNLSDVIMGLTDLFNMTYAEDGTFYYVSVYDGSTAKDRYVIAQDAWNPSVAWKQSYTVKDGEYSLKGERVSVHSVWMTDEEESEFNKMKNNYSAYEEELGHYHDEPKKQDILNCDAYSSVADTEAFTELLDQKTHFSMSIEDVQSRADEILLAAAKAGKVEFAKTEINSKPLMPFSNPKKRYGSLFENI